jgi:mRNA-degrading endonuclease RelE of RelBE toxin-antitoxin system
LIELRQTPTFKRAYKKLKDNDRKEVNNNIRQIAENPEIGELKTGDLAGVRVFKFRMHDQQILLAYEFDGDMVILLMAIGVHENFYRNLKKSR